MAIKLWGNLELPQYNVILGLSLSLICIILSAFLLIEMTFNVILFPNGIPKGTAILPIVLILIFHYFLFVYKSRYIRIEKEFKGEGKRSRQYKGRGVLLYTFGSLLLFVILMFFGIWLKTYEKWYERLVEGNVAV